MKILSYDIESTTGNHRDGSMCTFGYCIADKDFNILEQKDIVMRPYTRRYEGKIPLHYEKSFIKSQQPFPHFYKEISSLFNENYLIIGFSVSNDVDFLNNACDVYKLNRIDYEFLDVQLLYKTVYNKPNLSGLSSIAIELGIDYLPHRSDEDARVTLLTLKHIVNDLSMSLIEILRKYRITKGSNKNGEITPCTNGIFTKREINYLILNFVENNYKHSRRYKGGLSFKTFAFSDSIRYGDVDAFRKYIKKIYDLNGRIGSIESSNVFVLDTPYDDLPDKTKHSLAVRNEGKQRITTISLNEFLALLGDLPNLDFSNDIELVKRHRLELLKRREQKRNEKRKANVKK